MDLFAEAIVLVFGCDGELPKGPSTRLPQEFDFRVRLRPVESDRCDHSSIEFAYEAVACCKTLGGVFRGLMRGPIAQTACSMWGVCRTDQLCEGSEVIRDRNFTAEELWK